MNFVKLQIGCLIVALYIEGIYIWQTLSKNIKCNRMFDAIMIVIPYMIIIDGITAWTVNHLDSVPPVLNLVLHGIFFFFLASFMPLVFLYILNLIRGIPKNKILRTLLFVPYFVCLTVVFIFLPKLNYVIGKTSNYSMGISVYACYFSVIFYFSATFIFTITKLRTIEARKRVNIVTFMTLTLFILVLQAIFPEILISSLVPTFLLMSLYINIEDPALTRLRKYNNDTVTSFAALVESRDSSTGGHVKRTQSYVKIILDEINKNHLYPEIMTRDFEDNMFNAAPMHDIGKMSTPDTILQKPGKLTDEEYEIMKLHAAKGGEIIKETFRDLEEPEFLETAYLVARYHHEKWNGKGYPEGLKETQIPFPARIMAIADVFDAVSAKRCYRDALPLDVCFKIIEDGAGSDFDPQLAQLFLNAKEKITKICRP